MKTQILISGGLLLLSLTPLFLFFRQEKIADSAAAGAFILLLITILYRIFTEVILPPKKTPRSLGNSN